MKRIRVRRPSPALVVALLALAVALGGTSWASSSKSTNPPAKHGDANQDRGLVRSMAPDLSVKFAQSAGRAAPSGAAGGDLQGSYPNPTIKAPAVTQLVQQTAEGIDCRTHPLTLCRLDVNNYWNQPVPPTNDSYAGVIVDALGFVHFQGAVQRIGPNLNPFGLSFLFWLPPSMRPSAALQFTALDTTAKFSGGTVSYSPVMISVGPDGLVSAFGTTADGDKISLSGISFHP